MSSPEKNVVLFSGGKSEPNMPYFHYAEAWLPDFLHKNLGEHPSIMYIPWAVWSDSDADKMFQNGQEHWGRFQLDIQPLHKQHDMVKAIEKADAIIVGGGSIHMLVQSLVEHNLMFPIHDRITNGGLYIGESAGSVLACPTRLSALEPSFIQLAEINTLDLIPFQITPHYYDVVSGTHHSGPAPSARIRNYIKLNPHSFPVLAIKDGSWLHVTHETITLLGEKTARIFNLNGSDERIPSHGDVSSLLDTDSDHYKNRIDP
jgi:dipeptidase E